jgi:hypothetical protein
MIGIVGVKYIGTRNKQEHESKIDGIDEQDRPGEYKRTVSVGT